MNHTNFERVAENVRRRGERRTLWLAGFAILGSLLFSTQSFNSATAHAELERASPAPDALLAAPPQQLDFWFTERTAAEPNPPSISILDQSGSEVAVTAIEIDPEDARHVTADIGGIATGTFTVVWSVLSGDDGHTLTGTYGFRVGSGRAPGAASVEGERPEPWAVLTRWLTFFAGGVSAACFIWVGLALRSGSRGDKKRQLLVAGVSAGIGLFATALEPILQSRLPPSGASRSTLSEALSGLPDAWWLRPTGLIIAIVSAALIYPLTERGKRLQVVGYIGALGSLTAILGLSLTTHMAARQKWEVISTVSVVTHEWAIGLWVGGLAALALSWPKSRDVPDEASDRDPIRVFSRAALPLALIGIGTGIANSSLILPSVDALWESDWGRILIYKVVVMTLVLLLATYHRVWLKSHAVRAGNSLRSSVRAETIIAGFVLLGGVLLALSAPPIESKGEIESIDLVAPLPGNEITDEVVHLVVSPVISGENELRVFVSPQDEDSTISPLPVDLVRLDVISLNHETAQRDIDLIPDGNGGFISSGVQLTLDGWWEVDVLVRRPGVEDVTVPFFLMVPDPNVNGFDAPETPESSAEAQALVAEALQQIAGLQSLLYTERLASGLGTMVTVERYLSTGTEDSPPTSLTLTRELELLTISDRTWQRVPGDEWFEREYLGIYPPSEWVSAYQGGTGFALGQPMELNGASTQIVTFFVPESERQIAAWYAFWIDEATGHVVQETMISRLHYMLYRYDQFDEPVVIPLPGSTEATPAATEATPAPRQIRRSRRWFWPAGHRRPQGIAGTVQRQRGGQAGAAIVRIWRAGRAGSVRRWCPAMR